MEKLDYTKSLKGLLNLKKDIGWDQYNLYQTSYLLLEHSVSPNKRGKILEKKIMEHFGLTNSKVSDYDATINNGKGRVEIKTSVRDIETDRYNITNLREFKNFDYYLFCLMDSKDRFLNITYYLIPKKCIENNPHLKLNLMNSGGDGKRFSFIHGDNTHLLLDRLNVLDKIDYRFDKENNYHDIQRESSLWNFVKYYDKFTHVIEMCDFDDFWGLDIHNRYNYGYKWGYTEKTLQYQTPLTFNNSKQIKKLVIN